MQYVYYVVLEDVRHNRYRFTKGTIARGDLVERAVRDALYWDMVDLIPSFRLITTPQEFQKAVRQMPEDLYWCLNEDLLADYLASVGLNYDDYRYDDDAIAAANAVELPSGKRKRPAET